VQTEAVPSIPLNETETSIQFSSKFAAVNFSVRVFSKTVRTTFSGTPLGTAA
jgi:hypothetical protein